MDEIGFISYTIEELTSDQRLLDKHDDRFGYFASPNWDWRRGLVENPSAEKEDLAIIIALCGNTIIGRLGLWAGKVVIDGVPVPMFLLALFQLHENYRTTGVAGMMLLRARSHSRCLIAAGPVPPDVQKIYRAAGFRELGPLRRYVYFYNTSVILRTFLRISWLASALSFPTTPILKLYYLLRPKRANSSLEFRPVAEFGKHIDALPREGNYFQRDSATLNWVLATDQKKYAFEVYRDGNICGYCMLRVADADAQETPRRLPQMRVGSLMDYYIYGAVKADLAALVKHCVHFFSYHNVDVFECFTKDEVLADVCSSRGMIVVGGFRGLFSSPRGSSSPLTEPWHLTQGEGDVILGGASGLAI